MHKTKISLSLFSLGPVRLSVIVVAAATFYVYDVDTFSRNWSMFPLTLPDSLCMQSYLVIHNIHKILFNANFAHFTSRLL